MSVTSLNAKTGLFCLAVLLGAVAAEAQNPDSSGTVTNGKIKCLDFRRPPASTANAGPPRRVVAKYVRKPDRTTLDNFLGQPDALGCGVSVGDRFRLFLGHTGACYFFNASVEGGLRALSQVRAAFRARSQDAGG